MNRRALLVLTIFFGGCLPIGGFSQRLFGGERKDNLIKDDGVFDFVNRVQKRYYVIRRLEEAVERLLARYKLLCEPCSGRGYGSREILNSGGKFQEGDEKRDLGCSPWGCLLRRCSYQGSLHRGCLHRGCSLEQELSRVTTFWNDFVSYKYIMSDAYTRELLVYLIVLYDALLKVSGSGTPDSSLDKELFSEYVRDGCAHLRFLSRSTLDDLLEVVDILSAKSRKLSAFKPFLASHLVFPDFENSDVDERFLIESLQPDGQTATDLIAGVVSTGVVSTGVVPTGVVPTGVVSTGVVPTGVVPTGVVPTGVFLEGSDLANARVANAAPANAAPANAAPANAASASALLENAEPHEQTLHTLVEPGEPGEFLVNTTLRFYLIQRLNSSFVLLAKLALGKDVSKVCAQLAPLKDVPSKDVLSIDCFQSPVVRECLQKIASEGSLVPLLVLWESVCSYRHIGDSHLIRELLMVAIQVYRLLIKVMAPKQEQDEVPVAEALSLYSTISSLPLTDLLFLLDEFTQEAYSVADAYQQGAAQGWKVTVKQYWWVPPVVVAGCISLYMRVKQYLSRPQYRHRSV